LISIAISFFLPDADAAFSRFRYAAARHDARDAMIDAFDGAARRQNYQQRSAHHPE